MIYNFSNLRREKLSNSSDFSKIVNSTFSAVTGMVSDAKAEFDERIMNYLAKMDLVKREEFEVVQAMLKEARLEQENLKKRILELEKFHYEIHPECKKNNQQQ